MDHGCTIEVEVASWWIGLIKAGRAALWTDRGPRILGQLEGQGGRPSASGFGRANEGGPGESSEMGPNQSFYDLEERRWQRINRHLDTLEVKGGNLDL